MKHHVRGHQVTLEGPEAEVRLAKRVLQELYGLLQSGYPVLAQDVQYTIKILQDKESASVKDIFLDTVYISAMKRRISPKSLNQKRYIEAIRAHDIVFGVGPAGTGKTYLAMAMAVAALVNNDCHPHRAGPAGGGGRGKAGLPAGGPGGEGEPLFAAPL